MTRSVPPHHQPTRACTFPCITTSSSSENLARYATPSHVMMIQEAIHESPQRKLKLQEIVAAISKRYPDRFKDAKKIWHLSNTVRQRLSNTKTKFVKLRKPRGEKGRGDYWACLDELPASDSASIEADVLSSQTDSEFGSFTNVASALSTEHFTLSEPQFGQWCTAWDTADHLPVSTEEKTQSLRQITSDKLPSYIRTSMCLPMTTHGDMNGLDSPLAASDATLPTTSTINTFCFDELLHTYSYQY